MRVKIIFYEHLSSASSREERLALRKGKYIALLSASEQTHCAVIECDSECTPNIHAPVYSVRYSIRSYIYRVNVCFAVTTCTFDRMSRVFYVLLRQHEGGTDTDITVSTESLTAEKTILPPFLPGLEPETFRSRVRRSNH